MCRLGKFGIGVAWMAAGAALGALTNGLPPPAFKWVVLLVATVCAVGLPIVLLLLAAAVLDWLRMVIRGP